MIDDWYVDFDSAVWEERDLKFRAVNETGELEYIVRHHRLRDVAQRTSAEVLSLNLPFLRDALVRLARGSRPGQTLTLG